MDDLLHAWHYSQSWECGIVQNSVCSSSGRETVSVHANEIKMH